MADSYDMEVESDSSNASDYAWLRTALTNDPRPIPISEAPLPFASTIEPRQVDLCAPGHCRSCGLELVGLYDTKFWELRPGLHACRGCGLIHLRNKHLLVKALLFTVMLTFLFLAMGSFEFWDFR